MNYKILVLMAILLAWPGDSPAQQFIIKFATLAPENSTWTNVMREYDAAVRKESDGRMKFKIYAGGVQ
ncbi:MAG: TRAP-type C4-dicarboxylate transport system, substrate-binding protein, partial [Bacteroidetes bacterium]|nr:TRAP-type C4-dicarboxylate transport system, substrate-binding protein [Bacteroidota bacterium]